MKIYVKETGSTRDFYITEKADCFLSMRKPSNQKGEQKRLRAELALGNEPLEIVPFPQPKTARKVKKTKESS